MTARPYEDQLVLSQMLREANAEEAYDGMWAQVDDELRAEWETQFDTIPYRSNGDEIHRIVDERLSET